MTPTQETKTNTIMLSFAVAAGVCALWVLGVLACTPIGDSGQLSLVVEDIQIDVSTGHVLAIDFVGSVHVHGSEGDHKNEVTMRYELMPEDTMHEVDNVWWHEDHFGCGDLGENGYWVRVLSQDNSSPPVKALLTIGDGNGMCGEREFNPGPNEEDDE